MLDTDCAKPRWGLAFARNGCAMICRSSGHRERVLLLPRVAGRSTSMMGTDRSKLSCRALLFLFVLLGMPLAARCDVLEDSAKELAAKIAEALPARDLTIVTLRHDVSVEVRNVSSLMPNEVVVVKQVLHAELQRWGIVPSRNNEISAKVIVTLSENFKGYVWTAEILQGDTIRVILATSPRPFANRVVSDALVMSLHSDKLWEGQERIVDVTFVFLPNFEQRMVLLVPDGLIITKTEKSAVSKKVEFPASETAERYPNGNLTQVGNRVESRLDGRACVVALDTETLVQCTVLSDAHDLLRDEVVGADKPKYGDQAKELPSNCGITNPALATGRGDYTQPDSVRILKDDAVVSNQLNFPGPILRFSQGPDTQFVTTIVHNLRDGDYEVYRLSISCGQ
jgi:hypothetical protein